MSETLREATSMLGGKRRGVSVTRDLKGTAEHTPK